MSRFDYVRYDQQSIKLQGIAKAICEKLEQTVETLPQSRAKALALTKLEEVYMWIGKAIRDEQIARTNAAPIQEERTNS